MVSVSKEIMVWAFRDPALTGRETVPENSGTPLENVAAAMHRHGARRVVFKLLANNDNSKQQIYFGGDFDVLRMIPHGELSGEYSKKAGVIFKAPLKLGWLPPDLLGRPAPAPGAQLIYYPRYPEVRMSGFLRGCDHAPGHLMHPPTPGERVLREHTPRCLVLGFCPDGGIIAHVSTWGNDLAQDATRRILEKKARQVASVFYELCPPQSESREELLRKLRFICTKGPVASCRLNSMGQRIPYSARNAAGYTLESFFGITPNGSSEPDFMGWELKAHSSGVLTLMTPEPDSGAYLDDLGIFLEEYGRSNGFRRDFTGRHLNGIFCGKSSLTLRMEGYDPERNEVVDPDGGLALRDRSGNLAAGWSFSKIISHWSKKHSQTAYVSYRKIDQDCQLFFQYGPEVLLCQGADINRFLAAMYGGTVYYDPGVNQKFFHDRWHSKKRNQFRVAWKNIDGLYGNTERLVFS